MLEGHIFGIDGRIEPNGCPGIATDDSANANGVFSMSSYFEIPDDVINRNVKNPMEVSMLKRMGEISRELDKMTSSVLSSVLSESKSAKAAQSDIESTSQSEVSAGVSQDMMKYGSHQPMEESTLFAESSATSGRTGIVEADSRSNSDTINKITLEKCLEASLSTMSKGITEMIGFIDQIRLFQVGNQYVAEELSAAHCKDLAEQKKLIGDSEKFIVEQLERLQKGLPLLPCSAPWSNPNGF